eukprot:Opistho-2@17377
MAPATSFTVLDDKNTHFKVAFSSWCPTMDLVGVVSTAGELWLHRLSWQRVWTLPAGDKKDASITAIAWRPDGRAIACGRQNGSISIVDVESGVVRDVPAWRSPAEAVTEVTCLGWSDGCDDDSAVLSGQRCLGDDRARCLLTTTPDSEKDSSRAPGAGDGDTTAYGVGSLREPLDARMKLTVLSVGDASGCVHLLALGTFKLATLDMVALGSLPPLPSSQSYRVTSVSASRDLGTVLATLSTGDAAFAVVAASPLGPARRAELLNVVVRRERLRQLSSLCCASVGRMQELWEESLLKLSSKLRRYTNEVAGTGPPGFERTAERELLSFLLDGSTSPDLQGFIGRELAEAELKRIAAASEASCNAVHAAVSGDMWRAASSMCVAASDALGLARWEERYGMVGVRESAVEKCVDCAKRIIVKAEEAIVVLTEVRASMGALHTWLLYASRLVTNTQDAQRAAPVVRPAVDLSAIARLLRDGVGGTEASAAGNTYRRVAQYFETRPLAIPFKTGGDSLATAVEAADDAIAVAFAGVGQTLAASFTAAAVVPVPGRPAVDPSASPHPGEAGTVLCCLPVPSVPLCLAVLSVSSKPSRKQSFGIPPLAVTVSSVIIEMGITSSPLCDTIRHAHMHGSDSVVVLVGGADISSPECSLILAKIPAFATLGHYATTDKRPFAVPSMWLDMLPPMPLGDQEGECRVRSLNDMRGGCASVYASSTRNVAVCVSNKRRKVRLLDLAEDEEEKSDDGEKDGDDDDDA